MKYDCPEEGCPFTLTYNDKKPDAVRIGRIKIEQHTRSHKPPIKLLGWHFKPYKDAQVASINCFGQIGSAELPVLGKNVKISFGHTPQGISFSVEYLGDFEIAWEELLHDAIPALTKAMGGDVCQVCSGVKFELWKDDIIVCVDCLHRQKKEASE